MDDARPSAPVAPPAPETVANTEPDFSSDGYDYYRSPDIAAFVWAQKEAGRGRVPSETEWSSLIFKKIDGQTAYYSYTAPKEGGKIWSPGPEDPVHDKLPKDATLIGQIHLHWEGSTELHWSNEGFSQPFGGRRGDIGLHSDYPKLRFYVVGAQGTLYGRIPLNSQPDPQWPMNNSAGTIYKIAINVYGPKNMTNTIPMTAQDLVPCKLN
jgi:hypothetical protein